MGGNTQPTHQHTHKHIQVNNALPSLTNAPTVVHHYNAQRTQVADSLKDDLSELRCYNNGQTGRPSLEHANGAIKNVLLALSVRRTPGTKQPTIRGCPVLTSTPAKQNGAPSFFPGRFISSRTHDDTDCRALSSSISHETQALPETGPQQNLRVESSIQWRFNSLRAHKRSFQAYIPVKTSHHPNAHSIIA